MAAVSFSPFASHAGFLRANSDIYEWLVDRAAATSQKADAEAALRDVAIAARFAAAFHPGRFADGAIENIAFRIGRQLAPTAGDANLDAMNIVARRNVRRVMHLASHINGVGGHTRMLYHWVRDDADSCHSLVVTHQADTPVPAWLSPALRESGGFFAILEPELDLCEKARRVRRMARHFADLVVLHHDPNDVIPTVAFARRDVPPVVVLNHADHQFWLGSSVVDMAVNLRTPGAEHTAERRFIFRNAILPVPLALPNAGLSRRDARLALGIAQDKIVLISIGRGEKFRPCPSHDFVATAWRILEAEPRAHIYVVGECEAGIAPYLRSPIHSRLHFAGTREDTSAYRSAADIYVESFPFGSQTAVLEAALSGLPVVPAYAPLSPLLVANDDALSHLLPNPSNEQEYRRCVDLLIKQPLQRAALGESLRRRVMHDHVQSGWLERLATLYQQTDALTHGPRAIPKFSNAETEHDIRLSHWHATAGVPAGSTVHSNIEDTLLRHRAFVAKYAGNYPSARRLAFQFIRVKPHQWVAWRLLFVTLLGRYAKVIRRHVSPKMLLVARVDIARRDRLKTLL